MRTTTLFTLATCLAFTGIRPIAGQELTPLDRTPPTLKSMYYDVNGDGKMEYLGTENNKERFTAWFALDGTVVERVANDVLTIKNILELKRGRQTGLHRFRRKRHEDIPEPTRRKLQSHKLPLLRQPTHPSRPQPGRTHGLGIL